MNRFRGNGQYVIISAFSAALFSVSEEAADKPNCLLNLLKGWKDGASFLEPSVGLGSTALVLNPLLSSVVSAAELCCVDEEARLDKYDASTELAGGGASD